MSEGTILKEAIAAAVISILLAIFVGGSFFTVDPGEVAIKTRLGKVVDRYTEGVHLKLPIVDSVTRFSIRVVRDDIETEAFSKDLQTIKANIVINHRVQIDNVVEIFRNFGNKYQQTLVDPVVQELFKAITAKMTAIEVISERADIITALDRQVKSRLLEKRIVVTDIAITNMSFTKQFEKAVEDKQIAEQEALTARKRVEQAKMEAEQQIAKARAAAEALKMQKEAVTPQLIELRKVEAQIEAIKKWNGQLPTTVMGGAVPFVDISGNIKK